MVFGVSFLDADESVILNYPAGKRIKHGPGVKFYVLARGKKVKKVTLTDTQYVKIIHKEKPAMSIDKLKAILRENSD